MRSTGVRVQAITVGGRLAGVVVGEDARIRAGLPERELLTAKAMALFAIEIHAGQTEGPYTQVRAKAYAQRVQGRLAAAAALRPGGER